MRVAGLILLLALSGMLAGCGMGAAARDTSDILDRYGCLSRDFRGDTPCEPAD